MANLHQKPRVVASLVLFMMIAYVSLPYHVTTVRASSTVVGELVSTIDTSQWGPPNSSPDPSGITYWPAHDRLLVVDGEVEEMKIFKGANLFEANRSGTFLAAGNTLGYTSEPVGIEVDPDNNRVFVSDDSAKTVHEIDLGPDQALGTADDVRRSFLTTAYGTVDPEGIAFGAGKLFLTSGIEARVVVVDPGPNGTFDGAVAPDGDDIVVSTWNTLTYGHTDPEGVDYFDGKVYIVSNKLGSSIAELDLAGNLLKTIDIQAIGAIAPSDLTVAPSTTEDGVNNLFVSARGVDNSDDPNENDGLIYEIKITDIAPTPTPPPDGNLLRNPGFEIDLDGDGPDHWSEDPRFTRFAAEKHSGTFSGRHLVTNNANYTLRQMVFYIQASGTLER
jgi:hypothetical protein